MKAALQKDDPGAMVFHNPDGSEAIDQGFGGDDFEVIIDGDLPGDGDPATEPGKPPAKQAEMTDPDDVDEVFVVEDDDTGEPSDGEPPDTDAEPPGADDGEGGEEELAAQAQAEADARVEARVQAAERGRQEALARVGQLEIENRAKDHRGLSLGMSVLDTEIKVAQSALVKAKEDGDTAEDVRLTAELQGHAAKRQQLIQSAETNGFQIADGTVVDRQPPQQQQPGAQDQTPLMGQQYMANNPWTRDPQYRKELGWLAMVDQEVTAERFDPNDASYWDEVSKRMKRAFPDLPVKTANGRDVRVAKGKRTRGRKAATSPTATAPAVTPAASSVTRKGGKIQVRLNQEHFDQMENFGLDPRNKDHLKAWAGSVMESEMEERAANS